MQAPTRRGARDGRRRVRDRLSSIVASVAPFFPSPAFAGEEGLAAKRREVKVFFFLWAKKKIITQPSPMKMGEGWTSHWTARCRDTKP